MRRALLALLAALAVSGAQARPVGGGAAVAPAAAVAAGYLNHTFSTSAFSAANVDMGATYAPGFQWYLANFLNDPSAPGTVTFNGDGSVAANDTSATNYGGQLASLAKSGSAPYYVGTAFGCGAYIDGVVAFNDAGIAQPGGGSPLFWPAFWTDGAEYLGAFGNYSWAGQAAGYLHWLEDDIFEKIQQGPTYYATLHDWFGVQGTTCPGSNDCEMGTYDRNVVTTSGINWSQWHHVAMLWAPATPTADGRVDFYFDSRLVNHSSQSWSQFTTQSPPAVNGSAPWVTTFPAWAFGVLDTEHLVILFGSGSTPINVKSVDVYQGPGACNLSR